MVGDAEAKLVRVATNLLIVLARVSRFEQTVLPVAKLLDSFHANHNQLALCTQIFDDVRTRKAAIHHEFGAAAHRCYETLDGTHDENILGFLRNRILDEVEVHRDGSSPMRLNREGQDLPAVEVGEVQAHDAVGRDEFELSEKRRNDRTPSFVLRQAPRFRLGGVGVFDYLAGIATHAGDSLRGQSPEAEGVELV